MSDGQERVCLRAREGEAVEWTRRVAQRAGTLKDMMDDAPPEDGVYPVPTIAAAELAVLREMCEADSMPARLEQCSISELFRLVEGASFLDAPGALNHAQRALASRLNGKRADELTELLGATDGFGSAEERVAALAEPAFSPEGQLSEATVGSAGGSPALQPQLTLWMAVTDDAKEVALGMVDVVTLAELKGVSRSWSVLARRVLCSRLSRCEGQPAPTQLAEITDLNIKVLVEAGRPWEAAAAGRMLPSLARLRWEGFEVNVAAVRGVDLDERDEDEDEEERPFLGGPAETALLSCIEGEGEPPLELLLAAVACAGSGEICGIPVQMMRDDSVSELDLQELPRYIGVEGGMLLAYLVPVMGALTKLSLAQNKLEEEGTKAICEALEQNTTLKELDISGGYEGNIGGSAGAKHVAKMLGVNGELTALDLSYNNLEDEGVSAVCKAIQSNKKTKFASLNFKNNFIGPGGANAVAAMVAVTGALTSVDLSRNRLTEYYRDMTGIKELAAALGVNGALTSIELRGNELGDEGWGAIFAAICGNKDSKIMSMDMSNEDICPAGVKLIAEALRTSVTGGLTALDLSRNHLKDESVSAVCEAIQSNKETKLASLNMSEICMGPVGAKSVAAMVAVTGGLTSLNLSDNQLCGLDRYGRGTYTVEGITAIADALCVNGTLTSLDLSNNALSGVGQDLFGRVSGTYTAEGITAIMDSLRVNGALTSVKLRGNKLGDEGWGAIFAAICGNKDSKIMSLDASSENIGSAGVKLIAEALRTSVTGALTALNLSSNNIGGHWDSSKRQMVSTPKGPKAIADALLVNGGVTVTNLLCNMLDLKSAMMLAEVAKQKGISLCGIQQDQTTADFSCQGLEPPDAILLAWDLSQAVVTGTLTECNLQYNPRIGEEGEDLIRIAMQGKAGFKLRI
jgi:Ran GTPase-activating protein (RanGAP) involved in mRNA processing and transport